MKVKALICITTACFAMLAACKKDNYDPPSSVLSGRIVYQGQPLGVRTPAVNNTGGSTTGGVQLELWQHGYQLFTKIPVYVNQDGTFSASLFDGDYKLVRMGGAPWVNNTDSIDIKVRGSMSIDVPVVPYFTINTPAFTFNKADTTITGTFTATQVVAGRTIEAVSISVGATQFVDIINNVVTRDGSATAGSPASLTITINPNKYPESTRKKLLEIFNKQYSYVRIGVKTNGVGERLYSTVQKLDIKF